MKICFRCSRSLPLSEFYRHPMMADGHLGKCKDCTKRDTKERREQHIDEARAYDRGRSKLPHRAELRGRVGRAWMAKHPERKQAHSKLRYALKMGRVQKRTDCQRCGCTPIRIEAHHWDYSQPLVVEWLCKPCHAKADQERRAA